MLSSDSDYPIEPNILPLTYELNAAGLGQSVWSCEGHADADGELCRAPAVWFYAEHVVHVELLACHVQQLEDCRKLAHRWRISPLLLGRLAVDCPTFSLAPVIDIAAHVGAPRHATNPVGVLAELRADIRRLACSLGDRVRLQAEDEIRSIRAEIG